MAGSSTRKKRRIRSPHPGVVLIRPDAGHPYWRARFVDPESPASKPVLKKVRLDPLAIPTAEARRDWAIRKAKELAHQRMDAAVGDKPKTTRRELADVENEKGEVVKKGIVTEYLDIAEHRLRPRTIELYRAAAKVFLEWADSEGITMSDELKPTKLPSCRDYLLGQRKQAYVRGGRRGQRKPGKVKLSPLTINWQLRAIKTMLNEFRLRGTAPLTRDTITDCLKLLTAPREAPEFLRQAECAKTLEAALRHDADTFAATRKEHARRRGDKATREAPVNATARYEPIAPYVALVMLTGMRRNEALGLTWGYVDLDACDHDGKPAGEIRLPAHATKNKIARTIGFDVAPTLRALFAAMKLRVGKVKAETFVFGGDVAWEETLVAAARKRLVSEYGAPSNFGWQMLRSTVATYQCNAPGLFGAAAAFMSAKRLGHSVAVSEKHYAGQLNGIPRDARTLEVAMGIEPVMARVVASASGSRLLVGAASEAV